MLPGSMRSGPIHDCYACVTLNISEPLASSFSVIPLHRCIKIAAVYLQGPCQGDLGFASLFPGQPGVRSRGGVAYIARVLTSPGAFPNESGHTRCIRTHLSSCSVLIGPWRSQSCLYLSPVTLAFPLHPPVTVSPPA